MATGEQKWSSRGTKVKHFTNNPIPRGTYQFELLGDNMEVKTSKQDPENSIPRIGVRFVAQGTAKEEGQKDRLYFHDFHLSLKPGKDTVIMPARGGQLIEFARAQGDELDDLTLQEKTIINAKGEEETVKYLDPGEVMEYLESKVGTVTEGKLTIEADTAQQDEPELGLKKGDKYPINDDHPGRNKMDKWTVDEANLQEDEEPEEEKPAPKKAAAPAKKPLPSKKR